MAHSKITASLTNREFKFAEGIVKGLSNIDACREAGFSDKSIQSLRVQAARLMQKPAIRDFISLELQALTEKRRRETEVDDIFITKQFKEVYERCMQRIPVMVFDREAKAMVQETNEDGEGVWTFDSAGAIKALENLAKHIGYYELDNKQRAPVIKIGAVQNVANYFFENPTEGSQISDSQE